MGAVAVVRPRWVAAARQDTPVEVAPGLVVAPRSHWATGLAEPGDLDAEHPGDVRFLLVHHSATANTYGPDGVAGEIRGFHVLHTGPSKGWPDVAYNFFVDRFGGVWEGRAGSLDRPVKSDATGGSQGFAQLCCLIGNFQVEPPTDAAQASLGRLLGWLAARYGVDPSPGATASFVSRGSNRWPAGVEVTTATIAGHRDMSQTVCPGDAAYALVAQALPEAATAFAAQIAAGTTPSTTVDSVAPAPAAAPAPSTTVAAPPTTAAAPATAPATTTTEGIGPSLAGDAAAPASGRPAQGWRAFPLAAGAVAASVLLVRRWRGQRQESGENLSLAVPAEPDGRALAAEEDAVDQRFD